MQIFFSSLQSLETFTRSLASLPVQEACGFCAQSRHWVSHGFLYKQRSSTQRDIVGKRILCSNRYGKQGCGHTRALYLAWIIPQHRYSLHVLLAFIASLIHSATITQAFHQAIGHDLFEPRQAYRWLTALYRQLGWFRGLLGKHSRDDCTSLRFRSNRLQRLLPSIQSFLFLLSASDFAQHQYQRAFI